MRAIYKAESDMHSAIIEALDDKDLDVLKKIFDTNIVPGTYYVREFTLESVFNMSNTDIEDILSCFVEHGIMYKRNGIYGITTPYVVLIKEKLYSNV